MSNDAEIYASRFLWCLKYVVLNNKNCIEVKKPKKKLNDRQKQFKSDNFCIKLELI